MLLRLLSSMHARSTTRKYVAVFPKTHLFP
jgi:hypothetical protein